MHGFDFDFAWDMVRERDPVGAHVRSPSSQSTLPIGRLRQTSCSKGWGKVIRFGLTLAALPQYLDQIICCLDSNRNVATHALLASAAAGNNSLKDHCCEELAISDLFQYLAGHRTAL